MEYFMVCGGIALGLFLIKLKDDWHPKNYNNENIINTLRNDLFNLFYILKPGKFIGPLAPLNNISILNNLVMVEDNESYTINKQIIHLCTKEPRSGKYYDKNTLMYVVLHELAHVLCHDIGHTDNFSAINQALIDHAIHHGFYDASKPFIKNYCEL